MILHCVFNISIIVCCCDFFLFELWRCLKFKWAVVRLKYVCTPIIDRHRTGVVTAVDVDEGRNNGEHNIVKQGIKDGRYYKCDDQQDAYRLFECPIWLNVEKKILCDRFIGQDDINRRLSGKEEWRCQRPTQKEMENLRMKYFFSRSLRKTSNMLRSNIVFSSFRFCGKQPNCIPRVYTNKSFVGISGGSKIFSRGDRKNRTFFIIQN